MANPMTASQSRPPSGHHQPIQPSCMLHGPVWAEAEPGDAATATAASNTNVVFVIAFTHEVQQPEPRS